VLEKFAYGGGYAGEDEGADDGVGEGRGGEGDATFASDTLGAGLGWLARNLGSGRCVFDFDFYEGGHIGIFVVVHGRRIDWVRLGVLVVMCCASIVPASKDIQVNIYLHLVYHFVVMIMVVYVVVVVMVVRDLGIGIVGASAGLNLLKPLLFAWKAYAVVECVVETS
jgi:hypothetical protein